MPRHTVVVVGGGITGLTLAHELSKKGHAVSLVEKDRRLGGLGAGFRVNGCWVERYYHHIFRGDLNIKSLIDEAGLGARLTWRRSKVGIYSRGGVRPLGSPLDILRFSPLSPVDRLRLGLAVLSLRTRSNWEDLDHATAEEWLKKKGGEDAYHKVWEPMLQAKFGGKLDRASAAWLWGRIKSRASSRTRLAGSEILGYLDGGFQLLFESLADRIVENGAQITTGQEVTRITAGLDGRPVVTYGGSTMKAECVIYTGSTPQLLKCCKLPDNYAHRLHRIKYRAVMCLVVQTSNPLSEFYWINIADRSIRLGGVIEHTNLVPASAYAGRNMTYLFRYLDTDDPLWASGQEEVRNIFLADLTKMVPGLSHSDIIRADLFKDKYATPVFEAGFADIAPEYPTPIKGLYLCGTSQVYPYDRSMDGSVRLARSLVNLLEDYS